MNLTRQSEKITQEAHSYGARIVQTLRTRRLSLVEKFPEVNAVTEKYGVSQSVLDYLNKRIRAFNVRVEVVHEQVQAGYEVTYPDHF